METLNMELFIAEYTKDQSRLFELLLQYAYEQKHVRLASGQESNVYLDCRQVYFQGEAQYLIGRLFYQLLRQREVTYATYGACGGMAIGAIPLCAALSAAAFRLGRELPGLCVRKEAKNHGMATSIEGGKAVRQGARVLLLEDVVTTGGSTLAAAVRLREQGYELDAVLALVDREAGGRENLAASGLELYSLFSLKDFVNLKNGEDLP